jgi:hypothetical protein
VTNEVVLEKHFNLFSIKVRPHTQLSVHEIERHFTPTGGDAVEGVVGDIVA